MSEMTELKSAYLVARQAAVLARDRFFSKILEEYEFRVGDLLEVQYRRELVQLVLTKLGVREESWRGGNSFEVCGSLYPRKKDGTVSTKGEVHLAWVTAPRLIARAASPVAKEKL